MSAGGLEFAASVAGLVSLSVSLFRGCIQAFELLETALHMGSDADMIRCKLEWEQYRLYQWANQIGLESEPNERINWDLVADTLKQLETLLTSSQTLKERYHLEFTEEEKTFMQEYEEPCAKSNLGKLLAKLKPDFPLASSRIIQKNNTTIRKLRWTAIDKVKISGLLRDIAFFNDRLHGLLESRDKDWIRISLSDLLRDLISRSNVSSELEIIKQLPGSAPASFPNAVTSAANLKQIRLILGLGENKIGANASSSLPQSGGPKMKLTLLKSEQFVRERPGSPPSERELARYKSRTVLVEWRFLEKQLEGQLKSRIHQLAILLGNIRDPSFHSLNCIGLLPKDKSYQPDDKTYVCYGLVFELILPIPQSPNSASPSVKCLSSLYKGLRKPSLNERLNIALALAETVLQLHTSGWLHKGIRSDNVLFIDMGDFNWEFSRAAGPYLAGYEYARPDNPHERTEKTPAKPELELYRHPQIQGVMSPKFRKAFDLFAFGCVLLEIALWSSIRSILETLYILTKSSDSATWHSLINARAQLLQEMEDKKDVANIAFSAGEIFREVIIMCFHASTDDMEDEDLEIQKAVVDKLKECKF